MPTIISRGLASISMAAIAATVCACGSIGPSTVSRDRIDYETAIGDSWKQQTLLNIVKLRYGDFPVFMEVAQVIAGYQMQTTVAAGFYAQNYITSSGDLLPSAAPWARAPPTSTARP